MVETSRQFSLRHIKHETKLNNSLYSMLLDQNLVDVILTSDGTNIRAHRLVLSANSSYFKSLFDSLESNRCQIPIIVLKDVPLVDLKAILEFMYRGEVCVEEKQLSSVLKSAELLKVFGLTEVCLALRSRLNSEPAADDKTSPASGSSAQKRPRISDGASHTTQASNELFSKLSNARFEIRPTHSALTPTNTHIQTTAPQFRTVVSTVIPSVAPIAPSIVKNVILPSNQIHKKSDSIVQMAAKVNTTAITSPVHSVANTQPMTASTPLPKSPTITTYTFGQKSTPIGMQTNAKINTPTVQTISPNLILSSLWTPSQSTSAQSAVDSPSSLGSPPNASSAPIEVVIDDETHDSSALPEDNEIIDVKPPIFELNERLLRALDRESAVPMVDSQSTKRGSEPEFITSQAKATETLKTSQSEIRSAARSAMKSRTPSTGSQSSLPPPPSYRVVQRSSSRLLRNIIKPTASLASTSTSKAKEAEEKQKSVQKRERQSVRLIRHKILKTELDSSSTYGESGPEIECPSCGEKFNDEKTWNEHIASVHLPLQT